MQAFYLACQKVPQAVAQLDIENVQKLLLEMGKGFALIGRQYHLEVDEDDYYIDFCHIQFYPKIGT